MHYYNSPRGKNFLGSWLIGLIAQAKKEKRIGGGRLLVRRASSAEKVCWFTLKEDLSQIA